MLEFKDLMEIPNIARVCWQCCTFS